MTVVHGYSHGVHRAPLVLADGAPEAGLGHLVRTSAVVSALRLRGIDVEPVALGSTRPLTVDGVEWSPASIAEAARLAEQASVILLDSYASLAEFPALHAPVACFFDPGRAPPGGAELVVAPPLDDDRPGYLCGLRFACLRPSYWGGSAPRISERVQRILVTTGGTDPGGISEGLIHAARQAASSAQLRRIRSRGTPPPCPDVVELDALPDLRPEIRAADLVVCLGGQTALEAACAGIPAVAVAAVANQQANVERLADLGAVESAFPGDSLTSRIARLVEDRQRRVARARAGQAAVDGFGALRVAAAIESALEERLALER